MPQISSISSTSFDIPTWKTPARPAFGKITPLSQKSNAPSRFIEAIKFIWNKFCSLISNIFCCKKNKPLEISSKRLTPSKRSSETAPSAESIESPLKKDPLANAQEAFIPTSRSSKDKLPVQSHKEIASFTTSLSYPSTKEEGLDNQSHMSRPAASSNEPALASPKTDAALKLQPQNPSPKLVKSAPPTALADIPEDVQLSALSFLDKKSLSVFARTSISNKKLANDDQLWKVFIEKDFPGQPQIKKRTEKERYKTLKDTKRVELVNPFVFGMHNVPATIELESQLVTYHRGISKVKDFRKTLSQLTGFPDESLTLFSSKFHRTPLNFFGNVHSGIFFLQTRIIPLDQRNNIDEEICSNLIADEEDDSPFPHTRIMYSLHPVQSPEQKGPDALPNS